MFWSISQEQLHHWNFNAIFDNLLEHAYIIFFKKVLIILEKYTKHAWFKFGVQFPLNQN